MNDLTPLGLHPQAEPGKVTIPDVDILHRIRGDGGYGTDRQLHRGLCGVSTG
jgi:hypothetical protein